MNRVLYWFRNDLRLADQPALLQACARADQLLPIYIHDPRQDATTPWGFTRMGAHRRGVLSHALHTLDAELRARGSRLFILHGQAQQLIPQLLQCFGLSTVYVEKIAAPEEIADVEALKASGVAVQAIWQSSLIHPESLPFDISQLPEVFSTFRSRVEKYAVPILAPLAAPRTLPPLPDNFNEDAPSFDVSLDVSPPPEEMRSAFPYFTAACRVDEPGAQAHLAQYLARKLPHTYKATRNALIGIDYSSKWSPFLALGTISARQIMAALRRFEAEHGANEGSYWLWFELLWRDYFRFLHLKHGVRLYRASGLSALPPPTHDAAAFKRWTQGHSGQPFVDAAMRELSATGYLSNRMRQVAASFLIHDLGCDWRAGAAWYESQLIDYDVYSNQGNWLYLAGRGTDPRGGRRFNPHKQAADYDADGRYTALWRDDSPHVRGGMA